MYTRFDKDSHDKNNQAQIDANRQWLADKRAAEAANKQSDKGNDKKGGDSKQKNIIGAIIGLLLAASLLMPLSIHAQNITPTPEPTPSIGAPPEVVHSLYLPLIRADDIIDGQQTGGNPQGKLQ